MCLPGACGGACLDIEATQESRCRPPPQNMAARRGCLDMSLRIFTHGIPPVGGPYAPYTLSLNCILRILAPVCARCVFSAHALRKTSVWGLIDRACTNTMHRVHYFRTRFRKSVAEVSGGDFYAQRHPIFQHSLSEEWRG